MDVPIWGVDAFTKELFRGNPAAVCVLPAPADPGWMQRVAAEMNLSETAFLLRHDSQTWGLRWFTPKFEVALCGHATLASAHALWESGRAEVGAPLRFQTERSGVLVCVRQEGGIQMEFPARPALEAEVPQGLCEALGMTPKWVGRSEDDFLCELSSEAEVRALTPDLVRLETYPVRGVIVTAAATPGRPYDFVSRFFAPAAGVPEDPVTGSAHCTLAPFWSERLGRKTLAGWQASARGGEVGVTWNGPRVFLLGQAVTAWEGHLRKFDGI